MKRYWLFLAVSALVSACSGPTGPSLRVAINSGVEGDGLKAAAKRWEARTGVRVVVSEFPYNSLYSKILLSLSGGASPFDIVMLDDPWFPKLASSGLLEELGPYFARSGRKGPDPDFVPASIALGRHPYASGSLYALPLVGNCQLLFYRKDLLAKHGLKPPKTWQELLSHARRRDDHGKGPAFLASRRHFSALRCHRPGRRRLRRIEMAANTAGSPQFSYV